MDEARKYNKEIKDKLKKYLECDRKEKFKKRWLIWKDINMETQTVWKIDVCRSSNSKGTKDNQSHIRVKLSPTKKTIKS